MLHGYSGKKKLTPLARENRVISYFFMFLRTEYKLKLRLLIL